MPALRRSSVALAAVVAAFCVRSPGSACAQVIAGRVIDAASGSGVPQARVAVIGSDRRAARRAVTGDDGRFSIALPGGGSYRVEVARGGYADARTRPVWLGPNDTVSVDVRISSVAHRLAPLTATGRRRPLEVRGVFREKRDTTSGPAAPTTANGRARRIEAKGTFPTPSSCYRLAGAADRLGSVVTLNVEARSNGDLCPGPTGTFTYSVAVRGLPPGSYTFRVLHSYRDAEREPAVALDTTVTVR
ncbi:MAG TPA: carboxypeptidase-like regulatory domain-containing protein [Longimicrobium sp.]|nr:carboxypeptidase-like regulatory domain-containing protein [Longimicrobium sp.]